MQNNFSKEEINEIIQWDVKNWKNALPFWDAHFDIKPGMKVLALGEREGGMSFYFAKLGCEVYCTDYNEMPEVTQKMHQEKGLAHKIHYKQIDIRDIDFEDETFDIVVFKSVLGVVNEKAGQDQSIKEIKRVLKKGGAFLFAENTAATKFHAYLRRKFIKWSNIWRYIKLEDFQEWSELFSKSHFKVHGFMALFGRSEGQRNVISVFDKIVSPITPKKWKYIYFGVYIK
jgi:ubiquinone/menaquinone biosynthesis C-methylase UbiE